MEYTTFFICTQATDFTQRRLNSYFRNDIKNPILYRLRYIPPYDSFSEIKKLQLLMHRKAGENSQNTLTVDLTEWLDHTNEEYFTVTLRFLADFADEYQPHFLLINSSEKHIQRVLMHLQCFFTVHSVYDHCFEDIVETQKYIVGNCNIAVSTAKELAQNIVQTKFPSNYMLLDRFIDELHTISNGVQITKRTLQQLKNIATPTTAMLLNAMENQDRAG